jgi:hypothetical protein
VDAGAQQLPARMDPVVRYRTDNSFVIVYKLNTELLDCAQREAAVDRARVTLQLTFWLGRLPVLNRY